MPDYFKRNSVMQLQKIAEYLIALPGRRKALFWVSPGAVCFSDSCDAYSFEHSFEIIRQARLSNVNIYPIDPAGLGGSDNRGGADTGDKPDDPSGAAADLGGPLRFLAAQTGGVAIVNRNDFDTAVPRILKENGSYYLIGYESPNLKTDAKFRKIDVKVNRPGVTVRARSGYYGAKPGMSKAETPKSNTSGPSLPADLEKAVGALVESAEIKMQVAAAPVAVPGKKEAAVAITLGVRPEALPDVTQVDDVDVFAGAFKVDGTVSAWTHQTFKLGAGWPQYELLTRIDLKPGRYQLRVSAESKLHGKAGSIFTDLDVPDFSKPLTLSGVVVHAEPGLSSPPAPSVTSLLSMAPTTLRDFSGDQQVTAFVKIYEGGKGKPAPVALAVRIRDIHEAVVFEAPQTLDAERFDVNRAAEYRLRLPLETLSPGPYLLTIEGTQEKNTARRDVRFQVH